MAAHGQLAVARPISLPGCSLLPVMNQLKHGQAAAMPEAVIGVRISLAQDTRYQHAERGVSIVSTNRAEKGQ